MPALRWLDPSGRTRQVVLALRADDGVRHVPLTLGSAAESPTHLHLTDTSLRPEHALIVSSGVAAARAYILAGPDLLVNDHAVDSIRALRHGDLVQLGHLMLRYLDFAPYALTLGSSTLGRACGMRGCQEPLVADPDDQVARCPWCDQVYHLTCWLLLERCARPGCYETRRLLLNGLRDEVVVTQRGHQSDVMDMQCTAACEASYSPDGRIMPTDDAIRCPNPACRAVYHPACWLSMRGPCVR